MRNEACLLKGCERPQHALGLCCSHYQRLQRRGTLLQKHYRRPGRCSVSDCGGTVLARGLCSTHYNRVLTNGSIDLIPRVPRSMKERFMEKVQVRPGCWAWTGAKDARGYGSIYCNETKRVIRANRASWILHFGQIPTGMCVLHKCDNPECNRPDHLFLGTKLDNVADMHAKGRAFTPRGIANGNALLNDDKVVTARRLRKQGLTFKAIGEELGVDHRTAFYAVNGTNWKHVKESQ